MIRFALLGSGSSGNAVFIRTERAKILIDNGLSLRQLRARLALLDEDLNHLDAVFVTHEHADHVNGLGTLARALPVPVYLTESTYQSLPEKVGALPRVELFEAGDTINVDGLSVSSFSISHDAADPVGYVVETAGTKLGLAADMGHPSELVRSRLRGAHGLILESNYCPNLLRRGSYPPMVQQRIRGRFGHLSNGDMSELLASLVHDMLQVVVLAHISHENNTRELAYESAAKAVRGRPVHLFVAEQDRPTRLFEVRP